MTAEIAVVAALILVPGAGAALALAPPGALSIETRLALAFGLGYGLVAATATALALAHVFNLSTFVAGVVLVTIAVWVAALWRAPLRAHGATLSSQAREAPFTLGVGLALLLAVAVTRPLYPSEATLAARSSWRYWSDGLEVAAAGQVPAQTQQWGIEFPTTVSKVVLNSFQGGISLLLGPDPLPAMQAILVVTMVGAVAGLLALGRELGLRAFAPLVPAMVVLTPEWAPLSQEIANDLDFYTAEDMGRLAAFAALLAGIYAARSRSRLPAVVTGLLFAVAGLTHLVPTLVAGLALTLYLVGLVILDRSVLRRALVTVAVVAAVFAVSYAAVIGASGGDLGFQRATTGTSFSGVPPGVDATRSFARGEYVALKPKEGHFLISPRTLVGRYLAQMAHREDVSVYVALALVALALASVALVLRMRLFLPLVLVAWGVCAASVAVAFYFSYRYETVVPGDWGARRLYDYAIFVPALLVPALLEWLVRPLERRRPALLPALTVLAGVIAVVVVVDRLPRDRDLARGEAGLAVIERVSEFVPCDVRMLTNGRTAGTWEATTGRRAVTEGHAVYLRPEVMGRVLPVLIGANEFWDDPAANRSFLDEQGIEYLVTVKPNVWVGSQGPRKPAEGDADRIAALPGVEAVHRDALVSIFSVGKSDGSPAGGHPARCPL